MLVVKPKKRKNDIIEYRKEDSRSLPPIQKGGIMAENLMSTTIDKTNEVNFFSQQEQENTRKYTTAAAPDGQQEPDQRRQKENKNKPQQKGKDLTKPSLSAKENEDPENLNGALCPYCKQPLQWQWIASLQRYAYGHKQGCTVAISTKADYQRLIDEKEKMEKANTNAKIQKQKNEIAAGKVGEADRMLEEAAFISEAESEEDLKQRLHLFEDADKKRDNSDFLENGISKKKEAEEITEEDTEEESGKRRLATPLKRNLGKIRDKITTFDEGQEEEVDKLVKENEVVAASTRKAVVIRNTVEIEKPHMEADKPKAQETKTSILKDEEDLGRTQLLVPEEPEKKLQAHPTLTDIITGEVLEINQPETAIGRSRKCHIQIKDSVISHEHAHLILKNDKAYLRDDKSSNGTFIVEGDDEENTFKLPLGHEVEIKDGCIIQFANRKFIFSMDE